MTVQGVFINPQQYIGQRYGRWIVASVLEHRAGHWWLQCRCDCGIIKTVRKSHLDDGTSKSCGCFRSDLTTIHGLAKKGMVVPEFPVWNAMLSRCHNKNNRQYPNYGGRGIKVCRRWFKFENFIKDMGRRPNDGMLERSDNNKGYSPNNCRWASRKEQNRNKRNNHLITIDGITKCLNEWSEESGVSYATIIYRLRSGWNERDAVFKPVQRKAA